MPFLLLIFALFVPRLVIILVWLFSRSWFEVVDSMILGILGFLFLPYTLLWYSVVENWYGGTWGPIQIIVLVIAILADIGIPGSSRRNRVA